LGLFEICGHPNVEQREKRHAILAIFPADGTRQAALDRTAPSRRIASTRLRLASTLTKRHT
jgi:hypothetical protein